jgi:hypothetical protein
MKKFITLNSGALTLNPDHIVSMKEASASSQWHGTRTIIKTVDGEVHEVQEKLDNIRRDMVGGAGET